MAIDPRLAAETDGSSWTVIDGPNDPVMKAVPQGHPQWEYMTGDAVRVDHCQHGEEKDKCPFCHHTAARTAADTATKRLQQAQQVEQVTGPDGSHVHYTFPDGWSIREPMGYGDLHREGELMQNCLSHNFGDNPYSGPTPHEVWNYHNRDDYGEQLPRDHPDSYKPQELYNQEIPETYRFLSLRDPNNLPHLTFDHDYDTDSLANVYGRHNAEPKYEHIQRLKQWLADDPQAPQVEQYYNDPGASQYWTHPTPINDWFQHHEDWENKTGPFSYMAKLARPADADWWHEQTNGDWYHGTSWPKAQRIMREGLKPWDEQDTLASPWANEFEHQWLEPRPGHVYLTQHLNTARSSAASGHYDEIGQMMPGAVLKIDPTYLDPAQINPDEDTHPALFDEGETNYNTLGELAEGEGYGHIPEQTHKGIDNSGSLAYRGTIPPEAISLHLMQDGPFGRFVTPSQDLDAQWAPDRDMQIASHIYTRPEIVTDVDFTKASADWSGPGEWWQQHGWQSYARDAPWMDPNNPQDWTGAIDPEVMNDLTLPGEQDEYQQRAQQQIEPGQPMEMGSLIDALGGGLRARQEDAILDNARQQMQMGRTWQEVYPDALNKLTKVLYTFYWQSWVDHTHQAIEDRAKRLEEYHGPSDTVDYRQVARDSATPAWGATEPQQWLATAQRHAAATLYEELADMPKQGKTAGPATDPPNYHIATEDDKGSCGGCKMFTKGKCWGYGMKPVEAEGVCDSFEPETRVQYNKHSAYETDPESGKRVWNMDNHDWSEFDPNAGSSGLEVAALKAINEYVRESLGPDQPVTVKALLAPEAQEAILLNFIREFRTKNPPPAKVPAAAAIQQAIQVAAFSYLTSAGEGTAPVDYRENGNTPQLAQPEQQNWTELTPEQEQQIPNWGDGFPGYVHDPRFPGRMRWSGLTNPARLQRIQQHEQMYGPDKARVLHQWPDGWSIREPMSDADQFYEGQLMGNCVGNDTPPSEYGFNGKWEYPEDYESWHEPWSTDGEGTGVYSLRDHNNYPRATFTTSPVWDPNTAPDTVNALTEIYGQANSQIKPQYLQRLFDYAHQNGMKVDPDGILPAIYNNALEKHQQAPGQFPSWVSKTANAVYYHVAPSQYREQIRTQGLKPGLNPHHVYVFDDLATAQAYQAKRPNQDVWQVGGGPAQLRETDFPMRGTDGVSTFTLPGPIGPERVQLVSKTAAQNVMYHVAPQSARESIQRHGIDQAQVVRPGDYEAMGLPSGNYLHAAHDLAQHYAEGAQEWTGEPHDIYQVNTDGLNLVHDPDDATETQDYSFYLPEPIEPERLQLVSGEQHTAAAPQQIPSLEELAPYRYDQECYEVASQLARHWPHLKEDAGFYVHPTRGAGDHGWNVAPDGTIVDMTAAQHDYNGPEDERPWEDHEVAQPQHPEIITPEMPEHSRYVSWTGQEQQAQQIAHQLGYHQGDPIDVCPECNPQQHEAGHTDGYVDEWSSQPTQPSTHTTLPTRVAQHDQIVKPLPHSPSTVKPVSPSRMTLHADHTGHFTLSTQHTGDSATLLHNSTWSDSERRRSLQWDGTVLKKLDTLAPVAQRSISMGLRDGTGAGTPGGFPSRVAEGHPPTRCPHCGHNQFIPAGAFDDADPEDTNWYCENCGSTPEGPNLNNPRAPEDVPHNDGSDDPTWEDFWHGGSLSDGTGGQESLWEPIRVGAETDRYLSEMPNWLNKCPQCGEKLEPRYDPAKMWQPKYMCDSCGFGHTVPGESGAIGTPYTDEERNQAWTDVTTSPNRDPQYINPQNWNFGQPKQGAEGNPPSPYEDEWDEPGDIQDGLWDNLMQWVPTEALKPMLEWDRNIHGDPARVQRAQDSLHRVGFRNPVWVDFNQDTNLAHLSEGNHRVTSAIQAGIPSVPVMVIRSGRHRPDVSIPAQYQGPERDHLGNPYVPQYMAPSHIGLPTTEPWEPKPPNGPVTSHRTSMDWSPDECPFCHSNDIKQFDFNPQNPTYECQHCEQLFGPEEAGHGQPSWESQPEPALQQMDPKCPECSSPMHWRDASSLTGLHPEGAWECSNQRCWNMLTPGELAPDTLPLPACPNCNKQLQDYEDSDNLYCPACQWEGELVNGKPQTSTDPGALMSPEHPDPWMDNEPGSLTLPEHWGGIEDPNWQPEGWDQEAYSQQGDRCPMCKSPSLMRFPRAGQTDELICPECNWTGEAFEHTSAMGETPSPLPASPVNNSFLTLNEVGQDWPMTGLQALGQPFIYDRGSQTVHMAPVGAYHSDLLRNLSSNLQGPIFQGEHDGGVIGWHTTPNADERSAVVNLLRRNYGHPFHDPLERGKDETGEFELPGAGEPGEGLPARSFGSKVLGRVKGWLSPRPTLHAQPSLGQESGQPGAALQTSKCATCGDPLPEGSADCLRCNWGGWNKADDALKNPIDPTIDMHRGIQAKAKPPTERSIQSGASRSEPSPSHEPGGVGTTIGGPGRSTTNAKHSADDFNSQPYWLRREDWQPGVEGKGWLGENGVHSWRIGQDRYPRHLDMRNNAQQAVGNLLRAFQIGADGKVYDIGRGPIADQHMQQILAADPRLHNDNSEPFTISKQASPLILGPSENTNFPEWQYGQRGKGYVNDQGQVGAWGVDKSGMPFHEQYAGVSPKWTGARQFYIEPTGEVHDYNANKLSERDYNSILGQNSTFFRPGPKNEQQFNLSKTADVEGYSNWHTFNVGVTMDNDRALNEESRKLVEQGVPIEQFRDWAIKKIVGPHNKQAIEDARQWNEIPEDERIDHHYEDFKEKHPEAMDLIHGLVGGPDVGDSEPDLIDPELINWDELYQGIKDEAEENAEYEREMNRLKGQGLGWATNHSDEVNQMRDAMYRYHGAVPEEDLKKEYGGQYAGDDPRNYFRRNVNIPLENFKQWGGWPENFLPGGPDTARSKLFSYRYQNAREKAKAELQAGSPHLSPEQIDEMLDARGAFRPDFIKPHFPGGKYDTPFNLEDPHERGILESDPLYQGWAQNGHQMRLHDFTWDVISAIRNGKAHPYTGQMQEALQQRGYTPEQIAQIMSQPQPWSPSPAQPDPSLDQPGDLTFPSDWEAPGGQQTFSRVIPPDRWWMPLRRPPGA